MAIDVLTRPTVRTPSDRRVHRITCIGAGGLAVLGGTLALLVHPWFAVLAAVAGIWLIFSPASCSSGSCCAK
jgi:hypothetical protein